LLSDFDSISLFPDFSANSTAFSAYTMAFDKSEVMKILDNSMFVNILAESLSSVFNRNINESTLELLWPNEKWCDSTTTIKTANCTIF
jgi:hypothetical protein